MTIKVQLENDDTGEDSCGTTILDAIRNSKVFRITELDDGRFDIRESCDGWFNCVLTKEQLKRLGREIINLTEPKKIRNSHRKGSKKQLTCNQSSAKILIAEV